MQTSKVNWHLAFIKNHFACLPVAIAKLEASGVPLGEAIRNFTSIRENLQAIPRRKVFLQKIDYVRGKNVGLATLEKIAYILDEGKQGEKDDFIDTLTPAELQTYSHAPITSCDVERSFSAYNRVLEDCRRSFVFENLQKHVVIHCNKFNSPSLRPN